MHDWLLRSIVSRVDWDVPSGVFSKLAYITQLPKQFDFENPLLPLQFHYAGPFHDGKGRLNADHLAFLVNQVLTDSTYRENACTLQKAIADANGLSVAADLIET